MRGKKCKRLLSWLLCACLMIGLFPVSAFAIETEQQSESTLTGQDNKESKESEQITNEQQQTTSQSEQSTAVQSGDLKENEEKKPEQKVATQAADGAAVTAVKLTENKGNVWGKGIITGSGDMDEVSWDRESGENKGCDSATDNNIIRSFDSITYNVSATFSNLTVGNSYTLVYEVTLPDDDELTLDDEKMNAIKPIEYRKNGDGTKTYVCKYSLALDYAGGDKEENVIVKVGNKHQDYVIRPTIKAYLNDDQSAALTVENMEDVTVTTAPMYNIVLQKKRNESIVKDVFDFNQNNETGKTYYPDNAKDYPDAKVTGYRCTYGFALELRKPGNGIKGVELPDASRDFTFDIDLSKASLNDQSLVENDFLPLLYYVGPNEAGGGAITEIPFTKQYTGNGLEGMGCLNSGNVSMRQEGTTLHVTVKNFQINSAQFPKKNYSGTSYWEDLNKIREGIFSSYQFQIVYPYINEKGENLQTKLGDGTVNVAATVINMDVFSEEGTETKSETSLDDNRQTNSWDMTSGNRRNQQIFYSDRKNMINSYSPEQVRADGDISAVGAENVAFTVSYIDTNVGEADERANLPVAVDQLVLFDRDAIENVEYSKYMQQSTATDKYGYDCHVRYAVLKAGRHLDSESMRTVTMDDFEFYDQKPEGGCDAVLVQYRGTNLGTPNLTLHAQFNATVNQNADIADKVYMITAFTKVWTVSDFEDEILTDANKVSLSEISREEISDWGKRQNATELVENKTLVQPMIDNRGYYTVPGYKDGVYDVDGTHKFNINSADALYIVPYTTTVTKTVAQTDENGDQLKRYNIGKNQRYVDYKISSSMKFWADVEPVGGSTTTVYFEDTIPKGLTYIANSAYWGGTYVQKYPQAGEVNGGQQMEPASITKNENGTTTLKWEIPNVVLTKGELPTLYYSCKISNKVDDNKTLTNTVTIQTNEDKRPIHKDNDNVSSAAISTTRDKEFYIAKRHGDYLELNDESYYELVASNTSSEDRENICVFDTMPYSGDGKSKQFKGNYQITSLTMDAADVNHESDMEIWYTDETKYIGKTAKDINPSEVTEANGWKKADASGYEGDMITFTGDGLISGWPTVIAYKDANLKQNTMATLRLSYRAVAGAEGDNFKNTWSTMSNQKEIDSSVVTDVYNRTIEGTVWFDKDKDGKIDDNEKKMEGVKVTLLVKNENNEYVPYTPYDETVDGTTYQSPSTVKTDKDGHYKFSALPSGEYRVKFESSDGTDLGYYDVTEPNADKDVTKTSKVEKANAEKDTDGKLTSGTITDITMPSLDEMHEKNQGDDPKGPTYNLPDQNLGLIIPEVEVPVTKVWNDNNNQDGKRTAVEITLVADGNDTDQKLVLNDENNWTGKFENLPKYDTEDMNVIQYTVKEAAVTGYTTEITGDAATGYVVTNTHTPETINVSGSKTWDDGDNQDGKRPGEITVRLLANGTEVANKKVTEADNWSWNFENLPKYAAGTEITYTMTEDAVGNYTTTVDGYNITNVYKPGKVSIQVTKAWVDGNNQDGKRPESIKVHLYADGKDTGKELELTKDGNWSGSFTDLDEYKKGQKIEYTVKEEKVKGYTSEVTGDMMTGYVITNTSNTSKTPSIPGTSNTPNTPDGSNTANIYKAANKKIKPVKTGDTNNVANELLLCLAGLGMAIIAYRRRDSEK